jgi:hypothetical protein
MPARGERPIGREKALGVSGRLEPLHASFPLALHKNVEDLALLVHSTPEIVLFATDGQKHFVEVPRVAGSRAPTAQLMGIGLPELPGPIRG